MSVVKHSRSVGACVAAGLAMGLLAACDLTTLSGQRPQVPDPFATIENTDLNPRYPEQVQQERNSANPAPSASYYGSGADPTQASANSPPVQAAPSGEGYDLNFENGAVTTVAKGIL